ncbi:MAG TPA: 4-alpha-glucanotransferase [Desulfurivibrionaceae bacterium]|nr:4-alpha-glucanotransferase [Desulfurivibrionaceae bacterium]
MDLPRGAGVLLHISSLPGPFGAGDLGRGARTFVDFLAAAGQSYWQVLPLGPSCEFFSDSPYMSFSAFAGNPLFIDLAELADQGLLSAQQLADVPDFSEYQLDYPGAEAFRAPLLELAWLAFSAAPDPEFPGFCAAMPWLDDYALFMALRERYGASSWPLWPLELAARAPGALAQARTELSDRLGFYRFLQFQFFRQWQRLHQYAKARGVRLIGDLPIYVGYDSSEVWANPDFFRLRPEDFQPSHVAGVPPDYFSATGQRWGNPLYRWQTGKGEVNQLLYGWWAARLRHLLTMTDLCRIDHFRAFESYWEIAAEEETAVRGRWVKGPGEPFFVAMRKVLGDLPIIAEDLGIITPEVTALRQRLGLPGMKVLQFGFDFNPQNSHLPHNYGSTNSVVYTGTHDNNTTLGWFLDPGLDEGVRNLVRRYTGADGRMISRDLLRLAFASVSRLAICPLQDILGFGEDCRMNTPGTSQGNWRWRCAPRFLTGETARWLREETVFYNRLGDLS